MFWIGLQSNLLEIIFGGLIFEFIIYIMFSFIDSNFNELKYRVKCDTTSFNDVNVIVLVKV